jgi:hypothetical protein
MLHMLGQAVAFAAIWGLPGFIWGFVVSAPCANDGRQPRFARGYSFILNTIGRAAAAGVWLIQGAQTPPSGAALCQSASGWLGGYRCECTPLPAPECACMRPPPPHLANMRFSANPQTHNL